MRSRVIVRGCSVMANVGRERVSAGTLTVVAMLRGCFQVYLRGYGISPAFPWARANRRALTARGIPDQHTDLGGLHTRVNRDQ